MIHHLLQMIHLLPANTHFSVDEEMLVTQQFVQLGRIASDLLHEIANPLTAATWNLESVLHDQDSSVRYKTKVKTRLTESLECLEHIQEVIKVSKHQFQQQQQQTFFSPEEEINGIIRLFRPKSQKRKISLIMHAQHNSVLYGNPIRFNQVISNLISNALDAYQGKNTLVNNRKILLSVKAHQSHVIVTIRDWGQGISRSDLKRIFTAFFTTKSRQHGSGLGLSIVKHIVEHEFQGKIVVKSELGVGTTFTLRLPLKRTAV
jgi:signal transduction histidine kinase